MQQSSKLWGRGKKTEISWPIFTWPEPWSRDGIALSTDLTCFIFDLLERVIILDLLYLAWHELLVTKSIIVGPIEFASLIKREQVRTILIMPK